ncbi:hypothetical protein D3C78_932300 [compost metagenome]
MFYIRHNIYKLIRTYTNEDSIEVSRFVNFNDFSFPVCSIHRCLESYTTTSCTGNSVYILHSFSSTCCKEARSQLRNCFYHLWVSSFASIHKIHSYTIQSNIYDLTVTQCNVCSVCSFIIGITKCSEGSVFIGSLNFGCVSQSISQCSFGSCG